MPKSLLFICITAIALLAFKPVNKCTKTKPKNFGYEAIIAEPNMTKLSMIGRVDKNGVQGSSATERLQGKLLRALRFQNITRKVEQKYGIRRNLILAMIMHETGGADLLPNGGDDGGLGLCHMQPKLATEFGLNTYQNCRDLRNKTHGRRLRSLIEKHKYDRKNLIQYDDRFHPILNIDAVGRMLQCYYHQTPIKGLNRWQSAIYRYAGSYNYRKYWQQVEYYRKKLNDEAQIDAVRYKFNRKNPNFEINGKKGTFDKYLKAHRDQNINYGLNEYK